MKKIGLKKLYVVESMPEPKLDSSELDFASVDDFEVVMNFGSDDEICE